MLNYTEELMVRFSIDHATATKLNKNIRALYFRHYKHIDNGLFIEAVMEAIGKAMESFDESKGILLTYLRTGIRLGLQRFNSSYIPSLSGWKFSNAEALFILSEPTEEEDEPIDFSIYTDREIEAMFQVIHGKPNAEDKRIVRNLFN